MSIGKRNGGSQPQLTPVAAAGEEGAEEEEAEPNRKVKKSSDRLELPSVALGPDIDLG